MRDSTGEHIHHLDLESQAAGTVARYWLHLANDKLGEPIRLPVMVARGSRPGPVLGLTAAIHGNELNGISVIQSVFESLDPTTLAGTVIGVLVVNVPGYLLERREFNDGQDLNRIAPGRPDGTTSQIYVRRVVDRIVRHFDLHIDLHTASFGRINSHYVRADMSDPRTSRLARLQNPQIIVHNPPGDTTLRGSAAAMGIASVTVELRDPHLMQGQVVADGTVGVRNAMVDLDMIEGGIACPITDTMVCSRSFWTYTDEGGLLTVIPRVGARVREGERVAEVRTIFGEVTRTYTAPVDAIIVGRSVNPLNQTGSRIAHFGVEPRSIPCITEADAPLAAAIVSRGGKAGS